MKKKLSLLLVLLLTIFLSVKNTYAANTYIGGYNLDYLLRNYQLVTFGTKKYSPASVNYNSSYRKGSLMNVYLVEGSALIRGDVTCNEKYYGTKINGDSYVDGYAYCGSYYDNFHMSSKNSYRVSGNYYAINNSNAIFYINKNLYEQSYNPIVDNYVDFDRLYSSVVEDQKKIPLGTKIETSDYSIYGGGYYYIDDISKINTITFPNSSLTSPVIITVKGKIIHSMPQLNIAYYSTGWRNTKNNMNDNYQGNVIWNFPEARYISFQSYTFLGHVVAPKADIELSESHYMGAMLANSIYAYPYYNKKNYDNEEYRMQPSKTAIQNYPYRAYQGIPPSNNIVNNIEEINDDDDTDIYDGDYSLMSMIKNYNTITLGDNGTTTNGTMKLFESVGPVLVNGNARGDNNYFIFSNMYSPTSSYVKGTLIGSGKLGGHTGTSSSYRTPNYYSTATSGDPHTLYTTTTMEIYYQSEKMRTYARNNYRFHNINSSTVAGTSFRTNNYIDFGKLYNKIIEDESTFKSGKEISSEQSTRTIHITAGGIYTIKDIENIDEIVIDHFEKNENKLTLININKSNAIKMPKILTNTGNSCTNEEIPTNNYFNINNTSSYSNYATYAPKYNGEKYYGNIIWNIPNSNSVTMTQAPFVGHIIAPKAIINMPEMHTAGSVIAKEINASGSAETHYYPYQLDTIDDSTVSARIYKVDDGTNRKIQGVQFELYDSGNNLVDSWVSGTECTDYHEITGLVVGEQYTIKEKQGLSDYLPGQDVSFTLNSKGKATTNDAEVDENGDIIIKNVRAITIEATKMWDDNENEDGNRPEKVTFNLYADGEKINSYDITDENSNILEQQLPYSKNGHVIEYSLTENAIDNYTSNIEKQETRDNEGILYKINYNITNHYTPNKTSLSVNITWDDKNNHDKLRTEKIKLKLFANGKLIKTEELPTTDNLTYIFEGLNIFKNNQRIEYRIQVEDMDGYMISIDGNQEEGYNIVNKHNVEEKHDNLSGMPNTGDTIIKYILVACISILILVLEITLYIKRKNKKVRA